MLDGIFPSEWISAVGDALDFVALDPRHASLRWDPSGFALRQRLVFFMTDAAGVVQPIEFDLPLISGMKIKLGRPGELFDVDLAIATAPTPWIELGNIAVTLHVPPDILKAYEQVPSSGAWRPVDDPSLGYDFTWTTGLKATFDGDVDFRVPLLTGIAPAMIADTGFILELHQLAIVTGSLPPGLPPEMVARIPPGFKGVLVDAELHYWKPGNDFSPTFAIEQGAIGDGGFSGIVAFGDPDNVDREYNAETLGGSELPRQLMRCDLGGAKLVLQFVSLTFAQSVPTGSRIVGYMFLPLVDKWVRINAAIGGPDGDLLIEVSGAGDEQLIKIDVEWLEILVDSLAYILKDEKHYAKITGSAKPKIGDLPWPKIKVEDLLIGSDGSVEMKGGWIDVPETFALDFHAFKIELTRIGFGTEGEVPDKWNWVGLSGGIKLIEGLPLSASVSGLKVSWQDGSDAAPRVTLEGVALSMTIPNTLKLEGAVSYRELPKPPDVLPDDEEPPAEGEGSLYYGHIFKGGINLEITALNMAVAGELMIGELTSYRWEGRRREDGETFVALFIMLNVELPTAIPLGATGAGLYGIKGLFGLNVAPDRHLDEEGEPESWYLWYKANRGENSQYSVTKVVKWTPRFDNFAFGAGLKLGTVYDDGFTINAGVLAAILIPGPVIMIEGRANLLKQRSGEQGMEGALYALIVFDGLAETFQMNVDVNFAMEDVITVAGGLEAFFDFNDGNAWFIHIGKREPLDGSKRIRADILSIITAKAFFMIEPIGIQFGASVGVDLQYEYGPIELKLLIRLAFELAIFWKEPQVTGMIELYIELALKIFGIGIGLILQCALDGSTPQPWWIHGIARAALSLPFPLPSFDVQVEFTWGEDGDPAVVDLLKGASMVAPKLTGSSWELPGASRREDLPPEHEWPLVPVDSLPSVSLGKPLTSISLTKDEEGRPVTFVEEETEGVYFGYRIQQLELLIQEGTSWVTRIPPFTPSTSSLRLRPDAYAMEPQVELWWYSPLDSFDPQSRRNYVDPCDDAVGPQEHCVDWRDVAVATTYPMIFMRGGLTFSTGLERCDVQRATPPVPDGPDRGLAIRTTSIRFSEPVASATIRWASGRLSIRAYLAGREVTVSRTPVDGGETLSAAGGFDTLRVRASGAVELTSVVVVSICWTTVREAQAAAARGDTGDRSALRSDLILEPHRSYVIRATAVRTERRDGESASEAEQTMVWGFHTGGLPGTDYEQVTTPSPCDYADTPLNKLSTYIARTVPIDGAPLFYRGYDVLVELTDPYAANMLAPVLSMRVHDRNGKQLVPAPSFQLLTGGIPFLTPGLVTMLSAPREGACAGTPVPWTSQILDRYIAAALPADTKPGRMVRVELVAALPYGAQSVFGFELATSSFRDATAHLASGLERSPGDPARGVQRLVPLGRGATPPTGWAAALADRHAARFAARETLRAALVFGPHDAGATIEEARTAMAAATEALRSLCGDLYELFDRGGSATLASGTLSYGGIHELFVAAGLSHRPLPVGAIETLGIDTGSGFFVLVESPEPIDWTRVTVRRDGAPAPLPVVWSADGARAFLFDADGALFSGEPVVRVSYHRGGPMAPDLDPLYRDGELSSVEEEVIWELA